MKTEVKIIKENGNPVSAVVPIKKWEDMVKQLETMNDILDAQRISSEIESGEGETFPHDFVKKLVEKKDHPLRLWRKYRCLTLLQLAKMVGVTKSALSMIENGNSSPSGRLLKLLSVALKCEMEDVYTEETKQNVKPYKKAESKHMELGIADKSDD